MRKVIALLVLFLSQPALAQEAQHHDGATCQPPDVVVAKIAETHPVDKMIVLQPDQAARVGVWYNQLPPEGTDTFTLVIILKHTNGTIGLLLGDHGVICSGSLLPEPLVKGLMRAIAGEGA